MLITHPDQGSWYPNPEYFVGMVGVCWLAFALATGCVQSKPQVSNEPDGNWAGVPEKSEEDLPAENPVADRSFDPVAPAAMLTVTVRGAKSTDGVYACALFDDPKSFASRSDPIVSKTISVNKDSVNKDSVNKDSVQKDSVQWTVDEVAAGKYAIAVYHDANGNGSLDRHRLGFPLEAYGFSNNARGKFGPPTYEQVEFEIADEPVRLEIDVK